MRVLHARTKLDSDRSRHESCHYLLWQYTTTILCHPRTFFSPGTSVIWFMKMHPILSWLQLIVPAKTEYPRSHYVSLWMNESMKHFKLIVLRFNCLIVFYARSWDSFHRNQASGHAFRVVSLLRDYAMTTPGNFGRLRLNRVINGETRCREKNLQYKVGEISH